MDMSSFDCASLACNHGAGTAPLSRADLDSPN